jgi:oligoendopeptidase F
MYTADIEKLPRHFLPSSFVLTNWENIEPYFKELLERDIDTKEALEQWMKDISELEAVVSEDAGWRNIKMTCDTENKELEEVYNFFWMQVQPAIQPYADALNKKLINHPLTASLDTSTYFTYLRSIRNSIELFRNENITLQAEVAVLQQQFGIFTGKMTVLINNKEYTLQQAAKFLENEDRDIREGAYIKIQERRLQDKDALNELFNQLLAKRNTIAANAGYSNYTDYRFKELGRFDYTKEDCFAFHKAVKQHILPLVKTIYEQKREKLSLDVLRPWDTEAVPAGTSPLHPFKNGEDLINKSIECFTRLRPFFGNCLQKMNNIKHLDLESRMGKAQGGYNYPLPESGAPFIFMNAAGQMHDVTTMVHEGGHAIHSFLAHPLPLTGFKEYPMEIAEVASMAMELFSMDHWDVFFDKKEELKRAKLHQLQRVITLFPWIAIIDKFQHWLYQNSSHTNDQRTQQWMEIVNEFSDGVIDYSGLDIYRSNAWQRQLHLFEVPFYYIEYGIAQLGAIGMWMQFKKNPGQALDNYCAALSLGGTKTLPELYSAAGLKFDFSSETIEELMGFVKREIKKIS